MDGRRARSFTDYNSIMVRTIPGVCGLLLLLSLSAAGQGAQDPGARQQPQALDAGAKGQIVDGAIAHLRRAYIFEDVAERMTEMLQANVAKGAYEPITEPGEFAATLTRQLQEVSRDKHLRIIYDPEGLPRRTAPTAEDRAGNLAAERRNNFGFHRVERLEGNVGYLELRGFSGSPEVAEAAVPAMNFLANTDALIIDLRRNGGGSPLTIGLISSYLFDAVTHLNDFYVRETDRRQQFFTTAEVEGRRYGQAKPVYVLTSSRTFSAAEEFTYNLKNLKRATIVGETTGGGAHPGGVRRITDQFGIWLPTGRAINPVTGTNWEGVGIAPDHQVDPAEALPAAHILAVRALQQSAADPRQRGELERALASIEGRAKTVR